MATLADFIDSIFGGKQKANQDAQNVLNTYVKPVIQPIIAATQKQQQGPKLNLNPFSNQSQNQQAANNLGSVIGQGMAFLPPTVVNSLKQVPAFQKGAGSMIPEGAGLAAGFLTPGGEEEGGAQALEDVGKSYSLGEDEGNTLLTRDNRFKPGNEDAFKEVAPKTTPVQEGPVLPDTTVNSGLPPTPPENPAQTTPATQTPNISGNKAFFTNDINKVFAPDAATAVNGAEHTSLMRQLLAKAGAYNYATAGPAADKLYTDIIDPELARNPQPVSVDKIQTGFGDYLDQNKAYLAPGTIAQQAATKFTQDLFGNGETIPPNAQVYTDRLFNLKEEASKALSQLGTYDKLRNGGNITDYERVLLAQNGTLSDIIANAHPQISEALKTYGAIKNAMPDFFKASQADQSFGLNLPIGLGKTPFSIGVGNTIGGGLRKIGDAGINAATSPIGKGLAVAGLTGLGVLAGAKGLPQKIADTFINKRQSQAEGEKGSQQQIETKPSTTAIQSPTIIPQTVDQVKPDSQTGLYAPVNPQTFKGSDGQSLAISGQDYTKTKQVLNGLANDYVKMQDPVYAAKVKNAIADLEVKNTASTNLNQWYSQMQTTTSKFNKVITQLNDPALSTGLSNAFGITGFSIDNLKKLNDTKYSGLIANLTTLQEEGLIPKNTFSGANNIQTLLNNLDQAYALQEIPYDTYLNQYVGSQTSPISGQATTNQINNPTANGLTATSPGAGLPTIPTSEGLTPAPQSATLNARWQPTGQSFESGNP